MEMPRGRLLRTKVKEWYWHSKKYWQAKFQARAEHWKNHPTEWLRELLFNAAKNVDPIEAAAILGSTVIVHEVLFKTSEFIDALKNVKLAGIELKDYPITGGLAATLWDFFLNALGQKSALAPEAQRNVVLNNDIFYWLMAFAISYYAIKHGADLLNVAKSFMGVGSVA